MIRNNPKIESTCGSRNVIRRGGDGDRARKTCDYDTHLTHRHSLTVPHPEWEHEIVWEHPPLWVQVNVAFVFCTHPCLCDGLAGGVHFGVWLLCSFIPSDPICWVKANSYMITSMPYFRHEMFRMRTQGVHPDSTGVSMESISTVLCSRDLDVDSRGWYPIMAMPWGSWDGDRSHKTNWTPHCGK